MSDEITDPIPGIVETPAITDEQIAEALGVEPDYFKEVKGQIKDLSGFYAKVNRRNMDLITKEREQAAKPVLTPTTDDDGEVLDEKSQRILRKFIEAEIAPVLSSVQSSVAEDMGEVAEVFAKTHTDISPAKIDAIMEEEGLWDLSRTAPKLKKNLERAYKLAKADLLDTDAEIERRVAERLKDSVKDGEEVVGVKPKRTSVTEPRSEADILADDSIPAHKKWELLNKV